MNEPETVAQVMGLEFFLFLLGRMAEERDGVMG